LLALNFLFLVPPGCKAQAASAQEDPQTLQSAQADVSAQSEEEDEGEQMATDPMLTDGTVYADPSDTEFVTRDGVELLVGGTTEIVYFNQCDETWADQRYGNDKIGPYGCGPTAMSMVISSLTDETVDPAEMAQVAVKKGCWASKSGSYSSIVQKLSEAYGLQAESFSDRTGDGIRDALLEGKVLVALMGPGHFTQKGHFILLRGVTLSGDILVADPSSRERSLMVWDPELILDELSTHTTNGGPLWAVYSPNESVF
jgi:hypothetical protein